ncbi:hypothetical protein [Blastomonas sp.]|uniref:hypothetical protein n=1 Tax=Blastomonas sp. TaxID=1909299 RepID=UPI00391AD6A2
MTIEAQRLGGNLTDEDAGSTICLSFRRGQWRKFAFGAGLPQHCSKQKSRNRLIA